MRFRTLRCFAPPNLPQSAGFMCSAENSFESQTILSNYFEIQESRENSFENCSSLENSFENPVIHSNSEIKESSLDESFKRPRNPLTDFNPRG